MKLHRIVASLLTALLLLPSCTPFSPAETTETVNADILTNVFLGTPVSLPETYTLTSVTPYHDPATGALTVLCRVSTDAMDEYHTVTLNPEGTLTADYPLALSEDVSIGQGVLGEDFLAFPRTVYDETTGSRSLHLAVYSRTDDTLTISDDLTSQFPIPTEDTRIRIDHIAADGDGNSMSTPSSPGQTWWMDTKTGPLRR